MSLKTYNQVVNRLKLLAESHQQINTTERLGSFQDWLTGEDKTYPCCVITNNGSFTIDNINHVTAYPFRIYFLDLVDLSTRARENVQDVWSDMLSIAQDYVAMLLNPTYQYDWTINDTVIGALSDESTEDYVAGAYIDIGIGIDFLANSCVVPQDEIVFPNTNSDMNVYDYTYVADGTEETTIHIDILVGKKLLLVTREYSPIYNVGDDTTRYAWDNNSLTLTLPTLPGERFHFLYRNYTVTNE